MTNSDLLALFDRHQRIGIEHPGARKEVFGGPGTNRHIVRFERPAPQISFVLYSRIDPALLDAEIAAQAAYVQECRLPFEWFVYQHDQPPGLPERLQAHGFTGDGPNQILYLDLQQAPAALLEAPTHPGLRRITQREGLREVVQVMESVYGGNFAWILQRMGDHLEIPDYLSVYVLHEDGAPACAAWTYFTPGSPFAGLWGGSTVAAARKRGLYTASLAARLQEAARRGMRYLYLDASEMSEPIVKRYGFRLLGAFFTYEIPSAD